MQVRQDAGDCSSARFQRQTFISPTWHKPAGCAEAFCLTLTQFGKTLSALIFLPMEQLDSEIHED